MTFFVFPFGLVVVVMCFFWGVPYFFLAFLAWIAALFGVGNLESSSGSRSLAAIVLCTVAGFGGAAGYLAWKDAITPDPISAREMNNLTDDAIAVISVLRASESASEDAELALKSTRAKARLREELEDHDATRLDVIEQIVAEYLRFEKSMERDLISFMDRRAAGDRMTFELSPATIAALDRLPDRIRSAFSADGEVTNAIEMMFRDVPMNELPEGWQELMSLGLRVKWTTYRSTYEDVMGRPMPDPE